MQVGGRSNVDVVNSSLRDASGYGIVVSDRCLLYIDTYIDTYIDAYIDTYIDTWIHTYIDGYMDESALMC
jgi:hypothetical protein